MGLNIELLTKISDWLKADASGVPVAIWHFDMYTWIDIQTTDTPQGWCGTTCCIGGAALVFGNFEFVSEVANVQIEGFGVEQHIKLDGDKNEIFHVAKAALDLTHNQAGVLFEPWFSIPELNDGITSAQAARTVDHLIKTGEVCWA
jgi:hypothetical protein